MAGTHVVSSGFYFEYIRALLWLRLGEMKNDVNRSGMFTMFTEDRNCYFPFF